MRTRGIGAAAAMGLLLIGATTADAQTMAAYNQARAYQHFAGSRYNYRVLYSSVPGAFAVQSAPFVYQGQHVEPGYSRQRLSPAGYGRYDRIPGYGGYTVTPYGYAAYYVPGYGRGLVAPANGDPPQQFVHP